MSNSWQRWLEFGCIKYSTYLKQLLVSSPSYGLVVNVSAAPAPPNPQLHKVSIHYRLQWSESSGTRKTSTKHHIEKSPLRCLSKRATHMDHKDQAKAEEVAKVIPQPTMRIKLHSRLSESGSTKGWFLSSQFMANNVGLSIVERLSKSADGRRRSTIDGTTTH